MGMKVDQQPNRQDLYEHIDPLLYRLKMRSSLRMIIGRHQAGVSRDFPTGSAG